MTRVADWLASGARGLVSAFVRHRTLTLELSRREVLGRYRGSTLGAVWMFLMPLLMLSVYMLAFGTIMKSRWPIPEGDEDASFAAIIFVGLIVHGFFSECLIKSPTMITSNVSYVKKIIFPLEILPWPMILSALVHTTANIAILLLFQLVQSGTLSVTVTALPLILLPLVILTVGVSWFLAGLSVYLRDLSQLITPLSTALLFLSTAIIPSDVVPERFRLLFEWNPISFIIDQSRNAVLWATWPDWEGLAIYFVIACVIAYAGSISFQVARRGFADVL